MNSLFILLTVILLQLAFVVCLETPWGFELIHEMCCKGLWEKSNDTRRADKMQGTEYYFESFLVADDA